MKFGVREICDVVLRAKAAQKIGNKVFYKNEPVLYFDSLKTSNMEGAATTVYAQGGRGNARLIAWEGERTVTFTMEDALISAMGFSVLTGAGLIDATEKPLIVHKTEQVQVFDVKETGTGSNKQVTVQIRLSERPFTGEKNAVQVGAANYTYTAVGSADYNAQEDYYKVKTPGENPTYERVYDVTALNFNSKKSELYTRSKSFSSLEKNDNEDYIYVMLLDENGEIASEPYIASESNLSQSGSNGYEIKLSNSDASSDDVTRNNDLSNFTKNSVVLVDYYVRRDSGAYQIDITPDKFGGNFYLEASTLFRATNGVDMPAEFIIPNCKIQSNFTFTMASSGDPSTFTFTMDAFPDYTRWDRTKKVYAAIQVIEESDTLSNFERLGTPHNNSGTAYDTDQRPWIETI